MWFFKRGKKKLTQDKVTHALMQVAHPELNRDVVALGMIRNLNVRGDRVSFEIQSPKPGAPYEAELLRRCREAVEHLGAKQVDIKPYVAPKTHVAQGPRPIPDVSHIVAIASGKGGVGKSTVSYQLARALARDGVRVGLLDCDIYGPSVPKLAHIDEKPDSLPDNRIKPHEKDGVRMMSMGFVIEAQHAVVWRGPMTHKVLQQFLFTVDWGELDILLLDMPPGTGDVQLSIAQLTKVDAALLVTTPQEIALADVRKGKAMFDSLSIPVLGLIQNMAYYLCGSCEKRHHIFQPADTADLSLPTLAEIPLTPDQNDTFAASFEPLAVKLRADLTSLPARPLVNQPPPGDDQAGWAQPGRGAFEV